MDFKRADRVADLIKQELSDILRREVGDPRIANITVTDVKLTDDLRSARIYFVELGKDRLSADVEKGLSKAKGFLKRELGKTAAASLHPGACLLLRPLLRIRVADREAAERSTKRRNG